MDYIPFTPSTNNVDLRVPLGDATYLFDTRWNQRENRGTGAWFIDLRDSAENPIVMSVKLVVGARIGVRSTNVFFKEHVLTVVDTSNLGREAGYDDLGGRVQVVHMSLAEFKRAA